MYKLKKDRPSVTPHAFNQIVSRVDPSNTHVVLRPYTAYTAQRLQQIEASGSIAHSKHQSILHKVMSYQVFSEAKSSSLK